MAVISLILLVGQSAVGTLVVQQLCRGPCLAHLVAHGHHLRCLLTDLLQVATILLQKCK